jgi:hypothetical protein
MVASYSALISSTSTGTTTGAGLPFDLRLVNVFTMGLIALDDFTGD